MDILELQVNTSDEEIDRLTKLDFNQFFITCRKPEEAQDVINTVERLEEVLYKKDIQRYEPFVVSIALLQYPDNNRICRLFEENGIPCVALTYDKYIKCAED